MSEYIIDQLRPSKRNIYEHTRKDYEQVKSIEEMLNLFNISVDGYYINWQYLKMSIFKFIYVEHPIPVLWKTILR